MPDGTLDVSDFEHVAAIKLEDSRLGPDGEELTELWIAAVVTGDKSGFPYGASVRGPTAEFAVSRLGVGPVAVVPYDSVEEYNAACIARDHSLMTFERLPDAGDQPAPAHNDDDALRL